MEASFVIQSRAQMKKPQSAEWMHHGLADEPDNLLVILKNPLAK